MNNNNLQKSYFSPKKVLLFSFVVAVVHILHVQACNDHPKGKGIRTRRSVDSLKGFDRRTNVDGGKKYESSESNARDINDEKIIDALSKQDGKPMESDIYVFTPDTYTDDSSMDYSGIEPRNGDKNRKGDSKFGKMKYSPDYGIGPEFKDPFGVTEGAFGGNKKYEIVGINNILAVSWVSLLLLFNAKL